jgi:hypothetical protein
MGRLPERSDEAEAVLKFLLVRTPDKPAGPFATRAALHWGDSRLLSNAYFPHNC